MIYPDVSLQDWIKRYPELKIVPGICNGCGRIMESIRPTISKGYAGLRSYPCECGQGTNAASCLVTTNDEEYQKWTEILGSL